MAQESDSATANARRFLEVAHRFRLGGLVTEAAHPRDLNLSAVAADDPAAGLALLFDVDADVVTKFAEWARSGTAERIGKQAAARLLDGGRLFFTGCGATGRLSIQLVAAWRDYWQRAGSEGRMAAGFAAEFEQRAFSVMAGGDFALIKSVEGFEDYTVFGGRQIDDLGVTKGDVVFAITEGGETSFVIGTAWKALERQAKVFFVYNNPDDLLCEAVQRSREVIHESRIEKINLTTGPMAITGSTRMQATSIQLCAMMAILEVVIAEIDPSVTIAAGHVQRFAECVEEVNRVLRAPELLVAISRLVLREESIYRNNLRNNYYADRLAVDVLTDTTERSPTFCIPAFRKFDDPLAAESWSYLFLPQHDTPAAWRTLLKRDLQPVEWDRQTLGEMVEETELDRMEGVVRSIGREEILRFRIGLDGMSGRPIRPGDGATVILTEAELPELTEDGGFYRRRLEEAHAAGGLTAVIFLGRAQAILEATVFLDAWQVPAARVLVAIPENPLVLDGGTRLAVKMLLNALSTLTMVRLGRVMGNFMIWVVPSNLKLIDRATRYIQHFTDLGYEDACQLLHRAMEYVAPRMKAGKAYPSTVGLSVTVWRDKCGFEQAERILLGET
jgi:N-acetylmuramic acid 6-phosphate etherase